MGHTLAELTRLAAHRALLLKPRLSMFRRPFTVLDLGAGDHRLADTIGAWFPDAHVFTIDREPGHTPTMCTDISPDALAQLSRLEHFDVVIALNFLHHFKDRDWELATRTVCRMGLQVYIQLPPIGTERVAGEEIIEPLHQLIGEHNGIHIGSPWYPQFEHERPMWVLHNPGPRIIPVGSGRPWTLNATYSQCTATRGNTTRDWIPGMNIWNLHGLGASHLWLMRMVRTVEMPAEEHGDIRPWNMVCDGRRVYLIDSQHEELGHYARDDQSAWEDTLRMLEGENDDWKV